MTYLLDTDTLIYAVRGLKIHSPKTERQREHVRRANRIVARCRRSQQAGEEVGVSAITVAELELGAHQSGEYLAEIGAVRKILAPFSTPAFDAGICAQHYGEVRHILEAGGEMIGAMDLLIAAHARALGATLITNNTALFQRVPGLRQENWSQ
jgi:tRNA(fMet)-specific endonuclease VapC